MKNKSLQLNYIFIKFLYRSRRSIKIPKIDFNKYTIKYKNFHTFHTFIVFKKLQKITKVSLILR